MTGEERGGGFGRPASGGCSPDGPGEAVASAAMPSLDPGLLEWAVRAAYGADALDPIPA